jgi:REP element-mobilizing transposase RayT
MGTQGWHARGYLPHYDGYEISQHVVFRLIDSIPPNERQGDDVLDRGLGAVLLRDPHCARIVAEALLHGDGQRYALQAWCVMPNHVHALIATNAETELGQIVHAWKRFTTRRINRLLGRTGPVWAKDYFDRFIRNDQHFETTQSYIERNPVAAGLCDAPEDWPFSSAGWDRAEAK